MNTSLPSENSQTVHPRKKLDYGTPISKKLVLPERWYQLEQYGLQLPSMMSQVYCQISVPNAKNVVEMQQMPSYSLVHEWLETTLSKAWSNKNMGIFRCSLSLTPCWFICHSSLFMMTLENVFLSFPKFQKVVRCLLSCPLGKGKSLCFATIPLLVGLSWNIYRPTELWGMGWRFNCHCG